MGDLVITVVMITVDRSPSPNYLGATLDNFDRGGVWRSSQVSEIHLLNSNEDTKWLRAYRAQLDGRVIIHASVGRGLLPCENAGVALIAGAKSGSEWVLFCEDDIDVCDHFVDSVSRWLDRFVDPRYRVYSFGCAYPEAEGAAPAWEYQVKDFYGTQCFAIRPKDAVSLGEYLLTNPPVRGGAHPGKYDLMMHDWMKNTHPDLHCFLASAPSFVQHLGEQSVIEPREKVHQFKSWRGQQWRYL